MQVFLRFGSHFGVGFCLSGAIVLNHTVKDFVSIISGISHLALSQKSIISVLLGLKLLPFSKRIIGPFFNYLRIISVFNSAIFYSLNESVPSTTGSSFNAIIVSVRVAVFVRFTIF